MIEVTDLKKAYGEIEALRGVTFSIAQGEIVGLLGPNGAGKSTIIKTLTGYLQPDSGQLRVDGLDVMQETQAVQTRIGYLPENAPLYPELSVQRYLQMMAGLRQIPEAQVAEHIAEAVYATGLQQHLTRPIATLSKGFRQRVGLAQAILHRPKLLILDEPTVGLDPTQIVEIRHLIKRLSKRSTILFSTHILPEVEALCDRVLVLLRGEIKLDTPLQALARGNRALLSLTEKVDLQGALSQVAGVKTVELVDALTYRISADEGSDLTPALFQAALTQKWPVRELRRDVETLESIFNQLAVAG